MGSNPILKVGILSLLVNVSLVGAKLLLSFASGSLALRADAIHSLVDVFGSVALIIGLSISGRKSVNFPYGLYKVENVVSVIISVLLFVTSYELIRESISHDTGDGTYHGWVTCIVGVLILVPFFFGRYEISQGYKFNSPSLIADGTQFRADVLSASLVFAALIGEGLGVPLDRIATGFIALFIMRAGWQLLLTSMRVLLDASVDQSTLDKIGAIIIADPAIDTVKTITGRNSGRFVFVEAVVAFRVQSLEKAHMVRERIEAAIKGQIDNVDRVSIQYEPTTKTTVTYGVPLADAFGQISDHFGESPYFAIVDIDITQKSLKGQRVVPNPHKDVPKGKGIQVAEFLLEYKPDIVVARESLVGRGPGYVFADNGIKTEETQLESLKVWTDSVLTQLQL